MRTDPTRQPPAPGAHASWTKGDLTLTTDPARLPLDAICALLARSYWAPKRTREVIERSLRASIPFGVLAGGQLVGFARVISDRATYAYLCDVIVDESRRGQGVGTLIMECITSHPELQGLER